MNNRNITYTSKIRRVIVLLFPTSQILAESLLKISFIKQKISNSIKFKKNVALNFIWFNLNAKDIKS